MENILFRKQFLLTKESGFPLDSWNSFSISDYTLYYHPELTISYKKEAEKELYLIGYLFGHESSTQDNQEIISKILRSACSIDEVIKDSDAFTGQFAVIFKQHDQLYIFNDACAQREVYYTTDCSTIGSQISLMEKVTRLEENDNKEALEFYNSPFFQSKRVFLLGETHKKNVKHLKANHLLNINKKSEVRFFPFETLVNRNLNETAEEAAAMLKGYIRAASYRYKLAVPITAGYDSRVLFGASLEEDCIFFVFKHRKLTENHPDIVIPGRLLKRTGKKLDILTYRKEVTSEFESLHRNSIDFYRPDQTAIIFNGYLKLLNGYMVLNGNVAETARNFYGNFKNLQGKDLAFITKVEAYPYAIKLYDEWLAKSQSIFIAHNYHTMDMFYWEERMSNWAAKGKTEAVLGTEMFSPFNSRKLISLLLSVDRKYRETQTNKLFNHILFSLSPELLKEPVNPDRKTKSIILMKKLGIYNLYRKLGMKHRFLKF